MMQLIPATKQNIPRIMDLITQAKALLKANNVNQWQDGYPDQACIEADIEKKTGFLFLIEEDIVGYLCIDYNEPAYDNIDGAWLSIQPYVVVHRLTLDSTVRGQGLASQIFQFIEAVCRERNIHSFKIDTDEDNQIMKHILQKNGFTYCGIVNFQNSQKLAYEKLI